MSDLAIQISGLSKRYQIGIRNEYPTIRETLTRATSKSLHVVRSWVSGRNNGSGPGWIWALYDVDLEVKQGEVVGIIGRNGAGKSTLLKILSGVTEPTTGYADIYGRVGSLLEVGTGFHMELTGRENIFMNGALLGMSRHEIRRKFDEIVAFSEVEKFLDTPVKRYSSGMYMRLAFAVAAHLEPEILIVDEVLAVGDVAFQKKCLGKMEDVAQEGRTVLFVSHNMTAVASLTRRSLWLDGGKIRAVGGTPDVIESYLGTVVSNPHQDGFASLTSLPRPEGLIANPKARLEWVRTQDQHGNQTSIFGEGELIIVELGFNVHDTVRNLEFGVGVLSLRHGVELFLVPSPVYQSPLPVGRYHVRMRIDPNYLRVGAYSLVLKMFADGVRQETWGDTLRFNITENNSSCEEDGQYRIWLAGPLKFSYSWEQIEPSSTEVRDESLFS